MDDKFIDVERVIADKKPGLAKSLPRFVVRYFKRILHQREINDIIRENHNLKNEAFCKDIVQRFELKLKTEGLENIPKEGGVILACNHPLGGMDAMALVDVVSSRRKDITFIVNDILMNLTNLKDLFVGVNKLGSNVKESLLKVNEAFASDRAVFVFPSGLVSRKQKGVVRDKPWKKTFVSQSKRNQKAVIPVHIQGELSPFFYRLANLRRFLGIRVNIEMLYLVNELFRQRNREIRITFGKPIPHTSFSSEKSDSEWAKHVEDLVYKLG